MGLTKIDSSKYPEIMERFSNGESGANIAAAYGVAVQTIYNIRRNLASKPGVASLDDGAIVELVKPKSIPLRSFINKAWDSSIDAESWKQVVSETDIERQLAIDAAERAASAWKAAASNLARSKGNGSISS